MHAAASVGGEGCVYNQDMGRLVRDSEMTKLERRNVPLGFSVPLHTLLQASYSGSYKERKPTGTQIN